jgi:hypothetical protein
MYDCCVLILAAALCQPTHAYALLLHLPTAACWRCGIQLRPARPVDTRHATCSPAFSSLVYVGWCNCAARRACRWHARCSPYQHRHRHHHCCVCCCHHSIAQQFRLFQPLWSHSLQSPWSEVAMTPHVAFRSLAGLACLRWSSLLHFALVSLQRALQNLQRLPGAQWMVVRQISILLCGSQVAPRLGSSRRGGDCVAGSAFPPAVAEVLPRARSPHASREILAAATAHHRLRI